MSKGQDSRKFQRAPVSMEVQYRTKGSFLVSYSLNLSKGGLFLETTDLLPVGTQLTIRFSIPGSSDPIETQSKVMWVRRQTSDDGLPPGLGLQFNQLEERIGSIIDKLVEDFSGVRLLALADDPATLQRLNRYLQSILTCEVIQASSTEMAVSGFSDRIDLALLDLDSADQSGLMLIGMASRDKAPPIPIIALTRNPVHMAMAMKEGAAAVLENPPAYEQLRQCVLDVLGKPYRLT